jgi:hypothetical protein
MADMDPGTVTIQLPAVLAAEMERLKSHHDIGLSVQQIIQRLCEGYVRVGEAREWERAHKDELEQWYRDHPNEYDDAPFWEAEFQRTAKADPGAST